MGLKWERPSTPITPNCSVRLESLRAERPVSDSCLRGSQFFPISIYAGRRRTGMIFGMHYVRTGGVRLGPTLTPVVKYLVIACAAVFLWTELAGPQIVYVLGLTPKLVLTQLFLWQLATYLFLHGGFWHLFWNLFALWMFGSELERTMGSRRFLKYYFLTGIGAGALSVAVAPLSPIVTVGASGAIYGILIAYGMLFPNRLVYLYFLFPIKVKYFVAFLGGLAFISSLSAPGDQIAHVAHLGGMVFGFLYLKGWLSPTALRQSYFRWRINRMRRRFTVLETPENRSKKKKRQEDFWIN